MSAKQNRAVQIKNELESLYDDLRYNESEQMELRSVERSLKAKIQQFELEQEDLENEEEDNDF